MASSEALELLKNREAFLNRLQTGHVNDLDFSSAEITLDFSGLRLNSVNFANCKLQGSCFSKSYLDCCNLEGSDWTASDFSHATFNGCNLGRIKNAHKASGLHTVQGHGWLDWERIGALGRLPLFTASSAALVLLPIYFYALDVYNRDVEAWKAGLARHVEIDASIIGKEALDKFGNLPIPSLSLEALFSAVLLFIASVLYAFFCPARIKQFRSEQWRYELFRRLHCRRLSCDLDHFLEAL